MEEEENITQRRKRRVRRKKEKGRRWKMRHKKCAEMRRKYIVGVTKAEL